MTGGLLAVHAHPDDETLSTGALLATWAAAGLPTTVVTCTRGEQGEVIGPEQSVLEGNGRALAEHREVELAGALAALGVRHHAFLDQLVRPSSSPGGQDDGDGPGGRLRFADSGMAWIATGQATAAADLPEDAFVRVPVDVAAAGLADLIRREEPTVVVGYEPGGGYGHPDHVHAHRVMTRAVELATAHLAVAPTVLWAVLDLVQLRAAYRALAEEPTPAGLALPDPAGPVPSAAVPSAGVDVEVDVDPVLDKVLAAMRSHATQVQAVRPTPGSTHVARFALSNAVLQPLLATETYRVAHGQGPAPTEWPAGIRPRVA
ncbi:PIG-L family deacetylase [Actinotalea sp. C106]|uniref:PIG-L family deacetylase n=1 Tax=Actinotalea sp. C106 TaxID=2908644 RepID=UPI0020293D50|nr:PIG-L family deacetylase [Actinotalea sp. C106]